MAAAVAVSVAVAVGACGAPSSTDPRPDPRSPAASPVASDAAAARVRRWTEDIDRLLRIREAFHPDPWHGMDRAAWVAEAEAVTARLATLTDEQALVEVVRLAAMPGHAGRDGHTGISPFIGGSGTHVYPLRFWEFAEGLVITAAPTEHDDLVGTRIVTVSGTPIDEVLGRLDPLVPRDNDASLRGFRTAYLRVAELLAGLGVIEAVGPVTLGVMDTDGVGRDVVVEPVPVDEAAVDHAGQLAHVPAMPDGELLWLRDDGYPISWTELPDSRTAYIAYREILGDPSVVAEEVLARATAGALDRVVVDLRRNPGGNLTSFGPLVAALTDPAIDREGRLFVLIDRSTFSAATNLVVELERATSATFVGETMGGSPAMFGDPRVSRLQGSGQQVAMATRYWEGLTPDDDRLELEPDLPIELTWADWLAGRDPVLEAVIALP